jgi:hypothetical protein
VLHSVPLSPLSVKYLVRDASAGKKTAKRLSCEIKKPLFRIVGEPRGRLRDRDLTFFLPRLLGLRKAVVLVLLNPRLTAAEAKQPRRLPAPWQRDPGGLSAR